LSIQSVNENDSVSGRRPNEMKQKNYTTSQDVYHFHSTTNFISMIEIQGDEMGGKYMVTRDVRIS